MDKPEKYYFVYPESHEHLGLFSDLDSAENVETVVIRKKENASKINTVIRKIHTSWTINKRVHIPFQGIWYTKPVFDLKDEKNYCIIFIDIAINHINTKKLKELCNKPNVRCVLVCINSVDASSIGMIQIRKKIFQIPWHDVYTFDPGDMEKYSFKSIRNCYYSYHKIISDEIKSDVFFVGGLKGNREQFIFDLYKFLRDQGVSCCFWISARKEEMLHNPPYQNLINYYTGGWKPYADILKKDMEANVIIELLQDNQEGPSLRYYEAVCYNKKLITTNKRAVDLPYYNPKFIKIIEKPEDIDIDWVRKRDVVDYGYKNDFSPVNMLNVVLE